MNKIRGQYRVNLNYSSATDGVLFFPVVSMLLDKKICAVSPVSNTLLTQDSGLIAKINVPRDGAFVTLFDVKGNQFLTDVPLALLASYTYGTTQFEPRLVDFESSFLRFYDVSSNAGVSVLFSFI